VVKRAKFNIVHVVSVGTVFTILCLFVA